MSLTYRIYPGLGLVYVRYAGFVELSETSEVFARYMQDPDFTPGQKQFVDLSEVTGFSRDYAQLMAVQAQKVSAFIGANQTLIVYYAPSATAQEMADLAARSWDEVGGVAAVVQSREEDALAVLGLAHSSLDEMLRRSV